MKDTQLTLLNMQSAFNKDCNAILYIISPIVCNKKITKREVDKANKELLHHFGEYIAYKDDHGEPVMIANYTVFLSTGYGSRRLTIYKHDRSIQGDGHSAYMYEYIRTIYLEKDGTISNEVLERYKFDSKYMPTEKQIVKAEKEYRELEIKIKKLEDKKSSLPFHYYFNK